MLVLFFSLPPRTPRSTLFPYTTLFRSLLVFQDEAELSLERKVRPDENATQRVPVLLVKGFAIGAVISDRKSTRLNSSHMSISYAVFCLKKKIKILKILLIHLHKRLHVN